MKFKIYFDDRSNASEWKEIFCEVIPLKGTEQL